MQFEDLSGLSGEFTGQQTFRISLGDSDLEARAVFYAVVSSLPRRIAGTTPGTLLFSGRRFELHLINTSMLQADRCWSARFITNLLELTARISSKYPSLHVAVWTSARVNNSFDGVTELVVSSAHVRPSAGV